MLLNISSRNFGGLFWSRQLRGLPSSDGYFCNCDTVTQLTFKHNLCLFCLKNLSIFSWVSWLGGNHDTSLKYTDEWHLRSQQILYLCVFLHLRVRMCLCNQQLLNWYETALNVIAVERLIWHGIAIVMFMSGNHSLKAWYPSYPHMC